MQNSSFREAVDIVGVHYPDTGKRLPPPPGALELNMPLWASEFWDLGQVNDWQGALRLAQNINDNYVMGTITGHIIWNTMFSWYAILPFSKPDDSTSGMGHGVVAAAQPWSGHWVVAPTAYAAAHTTQFAMPGWHYLNQSTGAGNPGGAGSLPGGGTYLTLLSGDGKDFSIVIVTAGASKPQSVTFKLQGAPEGTGSLPRRTPRPDKRTARARRAKGLPEVQPPVAQRSTAGPTSLHAWRTTEPVRFQQLPDVAVGTDGTFTIELEAGAMYTLTTTSG